MSGDLDAELRAAHDRRDGAALTRLYARAADAAEAAGDADAAGFYLTHAYVFALACGDGAAGPLNRRLAAMGRDALQHDL